MGMSGKEHNDNKSTSGDTYSLPECHKFILSKVIKDKNFKFENFSKFIDEVYELLPKFNDPNAERPVTKTKIDNLISSVCAGYKGSYIACQ